MGASPSSRSYEPPSTVWPWLVRYHGRCVVSEDRKHYPYSPSTLMCREACPKYQPTQSENEASIVGTMQHTAVESGLDDDRIPDYRALAVAQCKELAEQRVAAYPGGTVLREAYLPVDDETVAGALGTTAGYADLCIVSADETRAEVIDWKFGKNAVSEASTNLQGIAYMLGLKKRYPKLRTCLVRFLQPHIDCDSSYPFQISDPRPFLLRVRTVVLRAIEAANDPKDFSTARATVGTCLFCALVGRCPKVTELAIQVARKYAPLVVPDDINTTTLDDPAKVSAGMKLAQVVSIWAESYRKNASAKAINHDDFIPEGYLLVESRRTKIKDARKVGDIAKTFLPPDAAEKFWR